MYLSDLSFVDVFFHSSSGLTNTCSVSVRYDLQVPGCSFFVHFLDRSCAFLVLKIDFWLFQGIFLLVSGSVISTGLLFSIFVFLKLSFCLDFYLFCAFFTFSKCYMSKSGSCPVLSWCYLHSPLLSFYPSFCTLLVFIGPFLDVFCLFRPFLPLLVELILCFDHL